MTSKAAIAGTFADIKTVRTRGVGQIVVEFPIERYAEVVNLFGAPTGETWLAVAKMNVEAEEQPARQEDKPCRSFSDLPRSQQAALCCQDEAFSNWLRCTFGGGPDDPSDTADIVRRFCDVSSRSELDRFAIAGERWERLYAQYLQDTGRMAEPR